MRRAVAAVTKPGEATRIIRAAHPDEGASIAYLWRELWDAHEAWGGYTGTRDPRVYDQLAQRLSEDARIRAGQPVLGRHVHLVAHELGRGLVGQVEGWFEKHGLDDATPHTCEVRSLIVSARARASGTGRALVTELGRVASQMSRGAPVVLAAEVLEPNPAHAFYARCGFSPVSYTARIPTSGAPPSHDSDPFTARVATPQDALALAMLEPALAERRRAQGDLRFDRPRAVDATFVGALAAHLARPQGHDQCEVVAVDREGLVRATASLVVASLDPPFVPARRGLLGRFAVDPALDPRPLAATLIRFARRLALVRGAPTLELTDLDPPGGLLYAGALEAGARPWSRIVERGAS